MTEQETRRQPAPPDREYLLAEMAHISNPESDFEYGHSFKRTGDVSVCRCGFTIEPFTTADKD